MQFWLEFWLKLAGMRTNTILARILALISRNKNKYNFGYNFQHGMQLDRSWASTKINGCLSVRPSIRPSVCILLFVRPSGCMPVWLLVCMPACLPTCMPACLPICLPMCWHNYELAYAFVRACLAFLHVCVYACMFNDANKSQTFFGHSLLFSSEIN